MELLSPILILVHTLCPIYNLFNGRYHPVELQLVHWRTGEETLRMRRERMRPLSSSEAAKPVKIPTYTHKPSYQPSRPVHFASHNKSSRGPRRMAERILGHLRWGIIRGYFPPISWCSLAFHIPHFIYNTRLEICSPFVLVVSPVPHLYRVNVTEEYNDPI
jgi:hypothetical protein